MRSGVYTGGVPGAWSLAPHGSAGGGTVRNGAPSIMLQNAAGGGAPGKSGGKGSGGEGGGRHLLKPPPPGLLRTGSWSPLVLTPRHAHPLGNFPHQRFIPGPLPPPLQVHKAKLRCRHTIPPELDASLRGGYRGLDPFRNPPADVDAACRGGPRDGVVAVKVGTARAACPHAA